MEKDKKNLKSNNRVKTKQSKQLTTLCKTKLQVAIKKL
jgi:hypothetical protein